MISGTPVGRVVRVVIFNVFDSGWLTFVMQVILWHSQTMIFSNCRRDMRWKLLVESRDHVFRWSKYGRMTRASNTTEESHDKPHRDRAN